MRENYTFSKRITTTRTAIINYLKILFTNRINKAEIKFNKLHSFIRDTFVYFQINCFIAGTSFSKLSKIKITIVTKFVLYNFIYTNNCDFNLLNFEVELELMKSQMKQLI